MKKKTEPLYRTSMVVLYMVLRFGWTLYIKYWEDFAGLSEDYTKEYGEQQLSAVNIAQAMPDASQRRGIVTQQGNELDQSSITALLFWKKLRRYIIKAIPGRDHKAAILQAGGAHFQKARQGNWSAITQLLTAGQVYLEANAALLLTNAAMPATFFAAYNNAKQAYDKQHISYGSSKSTAIDGTTGKIEASNALYKNVQFMFGDAQTVFDNKKEVAKQFTFAAIKRLVTKDIAGIHFTITGANKKPLTEAIITTGENGENHPVNKRGVANILMKAGIHSITVACPGFDAFTGIVRADAGIKHRVNISLEKEPSAEQPGTVSEGVPAEVAFSSETRLEQ